ncbi:WcbI family polysaccharide biosynthesis putative acetyltransferase [Jatrophihabitans endophyticus]|uniref:WcbI family polysaccharide biosynthesis putative acetyltransferase n=1 Tax=Jatrophihabitans endophyticus TaxID=1206085 RepID=UPI0019FC87F7|nr:WcbI family polysaccharide biosynthesis putative acetyltransferase [Jatrophihabitans endophyticus]MBE7188918.1 peptide ABC transporter ATPase [Jatrophihabitans endophyticus]
MSSPRLVVVWGNCQAAPLADLLRAPLAAHGLEVVDVPPVFLATEHELAGVHDLVRQAAVLVSQPIREEYRFPGSGTAALASRLPRGGRLVTVPTTVHAGPFPFLVHGHDAQGARVEAPLTDYHDLRVVLAASRGAGPAGTSAWWPSPSASEVRTRDADSLARLRRRENGLDVRVSDLVDAPGALWSFNHPTNAVLAELARRVLATIGVDAPVTPPDREYLAERQAPVEPAVAAALGWPAGEIRPDWVVRGQVLDRDEVVRAHLAFYAERPDVVAEALTRYADRCAALIPTDR